MKRLKLENAYHDAKISHIRFSGNDLVLDVTLCGCCNASSGPATLCFTGVRNLDQVRSRLNAAQNVKPQRPYFDEIIGIVRSDTRGYLLDLELAGGVEIDAQGLFEA